MHQDLLETIICNDAGLCPKPVHGTIPATKIIQGLSSMPLPLPWDGNVRLIDRLSPFEYLVISRALQAEKISRQTNMVLALIQKPLFGEPSMASDILQALATHFGMPSDCVTREGENYELRIPSPGHTNRMLIYAPAYPIRDKIIRRSDTEYQIPCPEIQMNQAVVLMGVIYCLGNSMSINSVQQLNTNKQLVFCFRCAATLLSKLPRKRDVKIKRLHRLKDLPDLPIPEDEEEETGEPSQPAYDLVDPPVDPPVARPSLKRPFIEEEEEELFTVL